MNIVIIGNGITGITCARNIRKQLADARIIVISGESEYFYSRTALMYVYMGHMKLENTKPYEDWFWSKNRIELIKSYVNKINWEFKALQLESGKTINYDKLIIATGSKPNQLNKQSSQLKGVQGLYSQQDLEEMNQFTSNIKHAVVIGGGLIGIEMAEMLHSRKIPVTLLVREQAYWSNVLPIEEAKLINRHIIEHGIDLRLETEVIDLIPDEEGRIKSIKTSTGEIIQCQFAGITIGVSPNIDFVRDSILETDRGILVNEYLETNIPDVYAAGDCAQFRNPKPGHPPVEQLWYTGKIQAESLAQTICGDKKVYQRGIWFNSAKFFDIEYQTYGEIHPKPAGNISSFYWEHPKGKIAFRVNFDKSDKSIKGFNFLGIRFRQAIAEDWIRSKKNIAYVIENLNKGWFDPEFSKPYYKDIQHAFFQSESN